MTQQPDLSPRASGALLSPARVEKAAPSYPAGNVAERFKGFHASLCRRFGYTHDEEYWWRDLVSLEEWIAAKVAAQPVATVKDGLTVAQPVAGEPVGYVAAIKWHPKPTAQSEQVVKITRNPQPEYGFTQPLYTAAPSPVALVPLTPAQRRRLWDNSPLHHKDAASMAGFERIVTLTERAHGIQAGKAEHPGGAHG